MVAIFHFGYHNGYGGRIRIGRQGVVKTFFGNFRPRRLSGITPIRSRHIREPVSGFDSQSPDGKSTATEMDSAAARKIAPSDEKQQQYTI